MYMLRVESLLYLLPLSIDNTHIPLSLSLVDTQIIS